MVDVLTPEQRRLNMSRIRGKDTKPELILRRGLHAAGFRYGLHVKNLPGCPDMVFPRYRAVIMVHGCFWHGHHCPLFKIPETRRDFWITKIQKNKDRDRQVNSELRAAEWRVFTVWECSLRGRARLPPMTVIERSEAFLKSELTTDELCGKWSESSNDSRQLAKIAVVQEENSRQLQALIRINGNAHSLSSRSRK